MYRRLVVDAAENLFANHGYAGTKIQQIAADSGLSLGTVYSVFDGKGGIYEAIHEDRLGELFELAETAVGHAAGGRAADRLLAGNRVFVRWLGDHPDFLRIQIDDSSAWASNPHDVSPDQQHAWQRGIQLMASVIEQAIQEGDVHPQDATTAARLMVAIQQVYLSIWVESALKDSPDCVADRIEEQLRRTLLKGKS